MIRHLNTSAFTDTPISWDWRNTIPHAYKKSLGLFLHIKYLNSTIIFLFPIALKLLEKISYRTDTHALVQKESKLICARVHGAQEKGMKE